MKIMWCLRCKTVVPMLEANEFQLVLQARAEGKTLVEQEIKARGIEHYQWVEPIAAWQEPQRYMIDMYRVITRFPETDATNVWHHVASRYGPICPDCGKPFSTPRSTSCVSCGYGKAEAVPKWTGRLRTKWAKQKSQDLIQQLNAKGD